MKAQLLVAVLLLTSCATRIQVAGRYAATLSDTDVRQISRLATFPHIGRTVVTIEAVRPDRVRVREQRYDEQGYRGTTLYVDRRGNTWHVAENTEITTERTFIVY
jgi:hypothetical protein